MQAGEHSTLLSGFREFSQTAIGIVRDILEGAEVPLAEPLEVLDETLRLRAEEIMSEAEKGKQCDIVSLGLGLRNVLIESRYERIKIKSQFFPERND